MKIKDNSARSKKALKLFEIFVVVNIIFIVSNYFEYHLLDRINSHDEWVTEDEISSNDLRQSLIGIVHSGLYIWTIVAFLNWFRRAYGNLHSVGVNGLKYKEKQAPWSFFIPFINLARPVIIMNEIWSNTEIEIQKRNSSYRKNDLGVLVGWWWGLFILAGTVSNYTVRKSFKAESIEEMQQVNITMMISSGLDIIALILVIMIIRKISASELILNQEVNKSNALATI